MRNIYFFYRPFLNSYGFIMGSGIDLWVLFNKEVVVNLRSTAKKIAFIIV